MSEKKDNPIKPKYNRRPDGRFGKGNVANPTGRPPKGETLTDLMREYLEGTEGDSNVKRKNLFIAKVFNMALKKGDTAAIKLIWNYLDGKPTQRVEAWLDHYTHASDKELNEELNRLREIQDKEERAGDTQGD